MSAVNGPATEARLRPVPARAGNCPRCEQALAVERLHLPGWRALVEGTCGSCDHRYLQDLPAGHALVYPASLDLGSGETFGAPGTEWFSGWLERGWSHPSARPVELAISGRGAQRPAVLLDCLDPIYGHSLLKLLNADRHLREAERDVVVLVPRALEHLVPDGVAETWTLDGPPSLAWDWLLRLDGRLHEELDRLGDCVLSLAYPHPHPSTWELDTFTGDLEGIPRGQPSFAFAFRDDRAWGLTRGHQALNLHALWALLRRSFPEAGGALIGVGSPAGAPSGLDDLRTERPGLGDERAWLAAAKGADLVIGMHGSHLLLPSALAALTLELVPAERHGNVLQATLVRERDPVLALWRYRQILGGAHLADVTPSRVAAVAAEMVGGAERFAALMAGPAAGLGDVEPGALPQPAPADRESPLPALARRARGAAGLARDALLRRRAAARAPSPPAVLTDRRGLRFELESADEVGAFLVNGGHFEADELDFLASRELHGTAIDVGANIGAFTAVIARGVGPDGHVHAFEPLAQNRRRLRRNLELNGLANVSIHDAAVADREGTAELATYGPGYESWASLTRGDVALPSGTLEPAERLATPTTTLDSFCARAAIERVAALKVDVEGAEGRVLSGARELLAARRVELLLLELSDNTLGTDGWTSGGVVRLLQSHGYETWVIEDGELVPFRPAGPVAFANVVATPAPA
jgi:FkbM family methyltransferase